MSGSDTRRKHTPCLYEAQRFILQVELAWPAAERRFQKRVLFRFPLVQSGEPRDLPSAKYRDLGHRHALLGKMGTVRNQRLCARPNAVTSLTCTLPPPSAPARTAVPLEPSYGPLSSAATLPWSPIGRKLPRLAVSNRRQGEPSPSNVPPLPLKGPMRTLLHGGMWGFLGWSRLRDPARGTSTLALDCTFSACTLLHSVCLVIRQARVTDRLCDKLLPHTLPFITFIPPTNFFLSSASFSFFSHLCERILRFALRRLSIAQLAQRHPYLSTGAWIPRRQHTSFLIPPLRYRDASQDRA